MLIFGVKNLLENIRKYILFLFLLFIPTQLGKHFWFDWTHVQGLRIDYLSPTFYFVDILFILLFIFNFSFKKININILLIFIGYILLNIYFSVNKYESIYKYLKLGELLWLFFYIKENKNIIIEFLNKIIPAWIISEVVLGLFQVINNGSLNNIFYYLGERKFNINTIGIAKWSIFNQEILRSYGTFSHPNSMAGFVLLSFLLWLSFKKYNKSILYLVSFFTFVGLFICGSRIVILCGIISLIFVLKKKLNINVVYLFLFFLIFFGVFFRSFSGWDKDSFNKRIILNISAINIIKNNFVFGVGNGNFLVELPKYKDKSPIFWAQPVHNVYLLFLCEFGFVGLFFLLYFLNLNKLLKIKYLKNILVLSILFIGFFDHYLVTLPQNIWLLVIIFGLI